MISDSNPLEAIKMYLLLVYESSAPSEFIIFLLFNALCSKSKTFSLISFLSGSYLSQRSRFSMSSLLGIEIWLLFAKPQNSSVGTTFTISITFSMRLFIFLCSIFVVDIIDCLFLIITLIPISLVIDSSVFSISPNLHDELLFSEEEKTTSASSAPFFFNFFKISCRKFLSIS